MLVPPGAAGRCFLPGLSIDTVSGQRKGSAGGKLYLACFCSWCLAKFVMMVLLWLVYLLLVVGCVGIARLDAIQLIDRKCTEIVQ